MCDVLNKSEISGSKNFQQDSSLAYRIENIVAAGAYMMKKSFYEEYLRGRKVSLYA